MTTNLISAIFSMIENVVLTASNCVLPLHFIFGEETDMKKKAKFILSQLCEPIGVNG